MAVSFPRKSRAKLITNKDDRGEFARLLETLKGGGQVAADDHPTIMSDQEHTMVEFSRRPSASRYVSSIRRDEDTESEGTITSDTTSTLVPSPSGSTRMNSLSQSATSIVKNQLLVKIPGGKSSSRNGEDDEVRNKKRKDPVIEAESRVQEAHDHTSRALKAAKATNGAERANTVDTTDDDDSTFDRDFKSSMLAHCMKELSAWHDKWEVQMDVHLEAHTITLDDKVDDATRMWNRVRDKHEEVMSEVKNSNWWMHKIWSMVKEQDSKFRRAVEVIDEQRRMIDRLTRVVGELREEAGFVDGEELTYPGQPTAGTEPQLTSQEQTSKKVWAETLSQELFTTQEEYNTSKRFAPPVEKRRDAADNETFTQWRKKIQHRPADIKVGPPSLSEKLCEIEPSPLFPSCAEQSEDRRTHEESLQAQNTPAPPAPIQDSVRVQKRQRDVDDQLPETPAIGKADRKKRRVEARDRKIEVPQSKTDRKSTKGKEKCSGPLCSDDNGLPRHGNWMEVVLGN